MVLGKLGPGQLGPRQLGPGQLGPGAKLSALKKWQIRPRTAGPWGPTVRGPVVWGPTVRGLIVRGPICLEQTTKCSISSQLPVFARKSLMNVICSQHTATKQGPADRSEDSVGPKHHRRGKK